MLSVIVLNVVVLNVVVLNVVAPPSTLSIPHWSCFCNIHFVFYPKKINHSTMPTPVMLTNEDSPLNKLKKKI